MSSSRPLSGGTSHRLEDYDFEYPESSIAGHPAQPRDAARLLIVDRAADRVEHARFGELPRYLRGGDCLVLNRTKVIPARLLGKKESGGKVDALLVRELSPGLWTALASGLRVGQTLYFSEAMSARVKRLSADGEWTLHFSREDVRAWLKRNGLAPLPPYIAKKRPPERADAEDLLRYQTVYAREDGSIAAPTAGFHFTEGLLSELARAGVGRAELTLHVGRGTFRPVTAADVREHAMLPESFEVPEESARLIQKTRAQGGRVIAVGTTATRTLETWALGAGPARGDTSLFIHPGHAFSCVDALLTNFHLPRSTPLLLAAAFAGRERLLAAYREAIAAGYRLFSYGDATLIL